MSFVGLVYLKHIMPNLQTFTFVNIFVYFFKRTNVRYIFGNEIIKWSIFVLFCNGFTRITYNLINRCRILKQLLFVLFGGVRMFCVKILIIYLKKKTKVNASITKNNEY